MPTTASATPVVPTATPPATPATPPGSTRRGLGLLRAIRRDPLAAFTREWREHGPIVRLRLPRTVLYLVSDPAAIKDAFTLTNRGYAKGTARGGDPRRPVQPLRRVLGDGLLTSEPALHRAQRRLIQPLFHGQRIAGFANTFAGLTAAHVDRWRDGEVRDVHRDMTELTLAIIGRTVFDVDLNSATMLTIRTAIATNQSTLRRDAVPWGPLLDRLPLPATIRWRRDRRALDAVIGELIADRRAHPRPGEVVNAEAVNVEAVNVEAVNVEVEVANGGPGVDLLSLLLAARTGDGEPMADELVRDEALTLLLAGHETTANALAWALHLLSEDPARMARLHAELDGVLGGRVPTAEDAPRLPYTRAVVLETMRLYPPAWIIARFLTDERVVCGYRLPPGAGLLLSPWIVHRDPRWWPAPEQFRPERWLTADSDRPAYAYFPFGGGPRQCIGNAFAELEAQLVLATIIRAWTVAPAPGWGPVRTQPLITLRPRGGVALTVNRR